MSFDDFLSVLDDNELEETPVDIDTFVEDERFLGNRKMKLSPVQRLCILNMTQIYRLGTLRIFLTEEEAQRRYRQTKNEVILMLGKGSGKDEMSAIAIAYIVYLLLCLKDPAAYYKKPSNDSIDILNIAINSDQAKNVFFKKFNQHIMSSPWFADKYESKLGGGSAKADQYNFNKNINVYSGHSEREAWEGYNLFAVVLDEIAGFALETASVGGKTAQAIYDMYRASVNSRFDEFGKYISLSFPRYKGDFITQRYEKVVAGKQTVKRREVLKIIEDMPDGTPGNEIAIEWDEDHIEMYNAGNVFALRRPPWDVNPTKTIRSYVTEFVENYSDSLGRYACMPPEAVDAFFKDRTLIEETFSGQNGWNNEDSTYRYDFEPDPEKMYFLHVDLAQKHDRAAVAMAHVERWVTGAAKEGGGPKPEIVVDLLRYWIPTRQKEVDFAEIQDFIVDLSRKGFNLRMVTFDQWRSEDMRKYLNSIGIKSELLSIKKEQYVDFTVVMHAGRLKGPLEKMIIDELLGLRLFPNGKIDHPRQGYKDLSDATCGAIFNARTRTPYDVNQEIEVKTVRDYRKVERNVIPQDNVIRAPSVKERMPQAIQDYLTQLRLI